MRTIIAILVAGLALAACGGDASQDDAATAAFNRAYEDGFKQSFRRAGIASCVRGAESQVRARGVAPPIGLEAACTCFVDRIMAGKSTAELAALRPDPAAQAVMEQCARELGAR